MAKATYLGEPGRDYPSLRLYSVEPGTTYDLAEVPEDGRWQTATSKADEPAAPASTPEESQ